MPLVKEKDIRIYNISECCVFRKTKEMFGGLSNMASGFPLRVNDVKILSSEALYQACKFPHCPDIQRKIISEKSPMTSKMVCKPYSDKIREDWEDIKVKVMRWCLQVKLAQNYIKFGALLDSTYDKCIVEESNKDIFWGAINKNNQLSGVNALGRLLMELRQFYYENRFSHDLFVISPLSISDFKLFGETIVDIDERANVIMHIKDSLKLEDSNIIKNNIQSVNYDCSNNKNDIIEEIKTEKEKRKKKKPKKDNDRQTALPF